MPKRIFDTSYLISHWKHREKVFPNFPRSDLGQRISQAMMGGGSSGIYAE